ncbi:glycogen synthase GlgA [Paenibacillus abyssi]|uniref:Glycogen synthase n=1 Tax=Paenibacillus abyssi TaxID=1340531 RepID=A0A917D3Y8_9BACL|nr:glycogen synthase GlgA [Paenibacillus abyssi]GGG09044.1 glycogen synthase [Paenibacillus abyssi]
MKVLFAAAEGSPFIKTGGLADVIGALPKALLKNGIDARVVLPKYKSIPEEYTASMRYIQHIEVPVGWRQSYCGIFELVFDGVTFYFLDNEYYFGARDGVYGHYDDAERFAFFNRAVLQVLPHIEFQPDIIHSHDWHTGMISPLLDKHYRHDSFYQNIRTIYTIHNLQYQGVFPYEVLGELLGMEHQYFSPDKLEYKGGVSFMKGGIVYSDRVTTVSRTYADEIQTPHFGEGLDGALRWLGDRMTGIVNGIDDKSYNPATDPHLFQRYRSSVTKKQANKAELQRVLGMEENKNTPMIGMVTRLTAQKGLDLLSHVLHELMDDELQLVILGSGDPHYEGFFLDMALRHPDKLSVQIRFDERLARQIYASSDLFLMPSQFEPCGLGQLIAMRYGSIPIVRETGGLNDTVQAYEELTGEGNGFSFTNYNAHDMLYTIRRALSVYHQPEHWKRIVKNAMAGDYSWNESARQYKQLYEEVLSPVYS